MCVCDTDRDKEEETRQDKTRQDKTRQDETREREREREGERERESACVWLASCVVVSLRRLSLCLQG